MTMTPAQKHNLIWAPFVFFVRVPILLPLFLLVQLGEAAETACEWLDDRLPGLER